MRMLHRWLIWTYLVTLEENGWKSSSFDGCKSIGQKQTTSYDMHSTHHSFSPQLTTCHHFRNSAWELGAAMASRQSAFTVKRRRA
ncbi:hypothetical protein I7I50_10396 [Histoplasma capsulatum G186AR]|uniref:Uncharacterized protein n=1 Tax=Ajellomyces capsulatus TaxID=5037 RepID=A0A8H7Z6P4_AJECA|nr:hypothetical protein I7I52_01635 [Histoplasma capsulatum]QSS69193.1 hypothetical protein I7I50_10396 [Histoplasma capsulatum G186AR]